MKLFLDSVKVLKIKNRNFWNILITLTLATICLTPIDLIFTTLNVIWPVFLGHQQIACFQRSLADFPANLGSAQQNIDGAVKLIDHECVSNIDESKTEELAKESFSSHFHPKNFILKFQKISSRLKCQKCVFIKNDSFWVRENGSR